MNVLLHLPCSLTLLSPALHAAVLVQQRVAWGHLLQMAQGEALFPLSSQVSVPRDGAREDCAAVNSAGGSQRKHFHPYVPSRCADPSACRCLPKIRSSDSDSAKHSLPSELVPVA